MNEHLGLRRALRDLAVDDAPATVTAGPVVGLARRMRRRRRAGAAAGCAAMTFAMAGLLRPAPERHSLVVTNPSQPPATTAAPSPSAPSPESASPSAPPSPVGDPGASPTPPASGSPSPTGEPSPSPTAGEPDPSPNSPSASSSPRKPKVVCNLIVDPIDDRTSGGDPLDIKSADIATGQSTIVGVLRLVGSPSAAPAGGAKWSLSWQVKGVAYSFEAQREVNGPITGSMQAGGTPQQVTVTVQGNDIRWSAPRDAMPGLGSGQLFTDLRASTSLAGLTADNATSDQTYTDRTPSCVRAD